MTQTLHNHIEFSDKRQHSRHVCNIRGYILLGASKISNCIVKDISIGGAKIMLPHSSWAPSEFFLELIDSNKCIKARKVWADDYQVGVEFV